MQLVYSFNIYKSSYKNYTDLISMCYNAGSLYNQVLDLLEEGINTKQYENISTLDKKLKTIKDKEINYYRKLKAQCSQQIIKIAQKNWKSFFQSLKEYNKDSKKFKGKPNSPKHKNQFMLVYTNQCCSIKNNLLKIDKNYEPIRIPNYKNKDFSVFNCVRIISKFNHFKVEIVYTTEETNEDVDINNNASIDLGINNLCAIVSKNNYPLLIDGKEIKSINQYYNKKMSKLKSIKKDKKILRKEIINLRNKRENKINDKFHKISRYIVNYCIKNKIGTLICGYNSGWKDSINIGKVNNQKFVYIPYSTLINMLKYKCDMVGIIFIKNEESYTSMCDSLALESIEQHEIYLGERVNRGLFQSSIGILINADVNGALNILRKCKGDVLLLKPTCRGFLFNPIKIRL